MDKIAILTDTHFGARSDSQVFRDYFRRFFEDIFFPYLEKEKITTVIHLGDLWDRRKYINFETLRFFRLHFFEPLAAMKINMVITLGNHDTTFKNSSHVNSVMELCKFYDNIAILETAQEYYFDDTKVLMIPWMNDENRTHTLDLINKTKAKIVMGHLELKGFTMQRGQKCETGDDVILFSKFDSVYSGHFHHKSSDGKVHYLGSTYEQTFADLNDPRGFHVWTPKTNELVFHQNPLKMFYRIVYDDKLKVPSLPKNTGDKYTNSYIKVVVNKKTNPIYFDQFMEQLFSFEPADIKIEEDFSLTEDENEEVENGEDTLMILCNYADSLDIELDKMRLKEEIRILWNEAQAIER